MLPLLAFLFRVLILGQALFCNVFDVLWPILMVTSKLNHYLYDFKNYKANYESNQNILDSEHVT